MRTWLTLLFLLAALPAAQSAAANPQAVAPETTRTFHEQVIGEITAGSSFKDIRISGDHIAWVEGLDGKRTVRLDGKVQGGTYDEVKYAKFSPGGDHFVFFGKRDTSYILVRDGIEKPERYDEVKYAKFSPGAEHFLFFGKHGSSWNLVFDGQEQPEQYDDMSTVSFTRNGDSYAFVACQAKKCQLNVAGTKSGPVYDRFSFPQYSRDGKKLAFLGKRDGKWFAVLNGKEQGPGMEKISPLFWGFTDDGSRFYVAGRLNGKWTYIVDGKPGPGFRVISPIVFTRDNQHYAYGGTVVKGGVMKKKKGVGTIVVDGKPGETHEGRRIGSGSAFFGADFFVMARGVRYLEAEFSGVSSPQFTSGGKIVYTVGMGKNGVTAMVGGKYGPVFERIISPLAVSRDASQSMYVAVSKGEFQEVRNHQVIRNFSLSKIKERMTSFPWFQSKMSKRIGTSVPWIRMSRDGAHHSYMIVSGGNDFAKGLTNRALRCMVIDGKPGPEYDANGIGWFDVTSDSKHYLYEVIGASGDKDLVNVDGLESTLYDDAWAPRFRNDEKEVAFIARQDQRLLRVTLALD